MIRRWRARRERLAQLERMAEMRIVLTTGNLRAVEMTVEHAYLAARYGGAMDISWFYGPVGLQFITTAGMVLAVTSKGSGSGGGKAPNTGSNTSTQRDNKATADGKPVDPKRPHTDR